MKRELIDMPAPTGVPQWIDALRSAMYDAIKPADMTQIVRGLVEQAKAGDAKAQNLLFQYVLGGTPKQVTNNYAYIAPPDPDVPTGARPGTSDKIVEMGRRARNGQALHHPEDQR